MTEYKVILAGDGGVGKTALIHRILHGEFNPRYVATSGVEISTIEDGPCKYNIWDIAGQEKYSDQNERNSKYCDSNLGIIMCSNSSRLSWGSVQKWRQDILNVCGDIPIIIVNNKIDVQSCPMLSENEAECNISTRNNTGIDGLLIKMYGKLNSVNMA
jgi:small GTP-binding protein